ncbi:MAG: serine/threonine-protein kinase [Sandaracinaceae bacterium]
MTSHHDGSDAAPSTTGPLEGAAPEYEFIKLLGRGGMAEVYLAHKFAPGGAFKEVAFKRILPQFTSDPARVGRFLDEIATAAALVHPHIVGVHHWGNYYGDYFIEMECVRGITLMDYLEAVAPSEEAKIGPIPAVDVALLGAMVAEGLHYAHTFTRGNVTGFVHRDISPDNIMLDLHGSAKILDYGIAKALRGEERIASETSTAAGKPYYHPPEQWRGDEVDARTDLYALGTTLAVALCGRQLFANAPKDSFELIVYRVFQGDRPPIAQIAPPGTPPELIALLESLVQADRERRPRTAKELIRPLKEIVRGLSGDLDLAREQLAARIKPHYGGDSDTHKALEPPQFSQSVPARSTRRPIDPSTNRNLAASTPPVGTLKLGGEATPAPSTGSASVSHAISAAAPAPSDTRRTVLSVAVGLGIAGVVVLALVAAFALGGGFARLTHPETPATTTPPAPAPVGGVSTGTPTEPPPVANTVGTPATPPPSSPEPVATVTDPTPPAEPEPTVEATSPSPEPTTPPVHHTRPPRPPPSPTPEVRPLGGSSYPPTRPPPRPRIDTNSFGL